MIVLDEQLLGRQIERDVKQWYRGRVCFITDLRPGTVIKDEAIPGLLRQHPGSLFVTINDRHPQLRTAALRSGKVLRVTRSEVTFYTSLDAAVQRVPFGEA